MTKLTLENCSWPTARNSQALSHDQYQLTLADNRTLRFDELRSAFDELCGRPERHRVLSTDDYFPQSPNFSSLQTRLYTIKTQAAYQALTQTQSQEQVQLALVKQLCAF